MGFQLSAYNQTFWRLISDVALVACFFNLKIVLISNFLNSFSSILQGKIFTIVYIDVFEPGSRYIVETRSKLTINDVELFTSTFMPTLLVPRGSKTLQRRNE